MSAELKPTREQRIEVLKRAIENEVFAPSHRCLRRIIDADPATAYLEKSLPAPEVSMQMLIDCGLNGFAFELVSESLNGKHVDKLTQPLRFTFRGIIYTIEPSPPITVSGGK